MTAPTLLETPSRVDFGDRFARRRRRRRAILVILGVVVAAALVWLVWFSGVLAVKTVRVVGVTGVPADAVIAAANVPVGVPLARLDTGESTAAVLRLPWVAAVEVRRGWPSEVVLAVTPRTPLAVVAAGASRKGVDASGVTFDTVGPLPKSLPTVNSRGVGLSAAMAVLASLPPDLSARVASVSATTRDDVDLVLRSGTTVHWGSADQADFKAQVLRALMRHKRDVYDVTAPELPTTFTAS